MIPDGLIKARVDKMALNILNFYNGKELTIFVILNGANKIYSDLFAAMQKIMDYSSLIVDLRVRMLSHY